MPPPTNPEGPFANGASTRPYLIRALHDWCTDNGFTPYLAVFVDASVQVPDEYVKNQEIVLNTSFEATSGLQLGNDFVSFKARFGGVAREIRVPVDHVIAIYARENGQGMSFPAPSAPAETEGAIAKPADVLAARAEMRLAPAPQGTPTAVPYRAAPGLDASSPRASASPRHEPRTAPRRSPAPGAAEGEPPPEPPSGGRPTLKRVK